MQREAQGCEGAGLMLSSLQLNEANERYAELEEQMEYTRSLYELIRNHFGLFSAENEALDISVRRHLLCPSRCSSPPPPALLDHTSVCPSAYGHMGVIPV